MKTDNHYNLAKELVRVYPTGSVCSQGFLRNQSLQLPRDVNDLRYKGVQLESYKGLKENLMSVKCTHHGTRQAEDYKLSEKGYLKLKAFYRLTDSGTAQPKPLQYHEQIEQSKANSYRKEWPDGHVTWEDRKPNEQMQI